MPPAALVPPSISLLLQMQQLPGSCSATTWQQVCGGQQQRPCHPGGSPSCSVAQCTMNTLGQPLSTPHAF